MRWKASRTISREMLAARLAANLPDWRDRRKLTRRELAKRVGISAATIGRLERGERPDVPAWVLLSVAAALDVTADDLVG